MLKCSDAGEIRSSIDLHNESFRRTFDDPTTPYLRVFPSFPVLSGWSVGYLFCVLAVSDPSWRIITGPSFFSLLRDPSIGRKETAYYVVEELVKRLKSQLEAAAGNLRRMAMDSPVYGSLSSIRFLLMDQQDHL